MMKRFLITLLLCVCAATARGAITDNLVSHWTLDETTGNAADSVGANTLTAQGSPGTAAGKVSNARDFESTGNLTWMEAADAASLDITGDLTLTFWAKPESAAQIRYIVTKATSSTNQRSYRAFLNTTPRFAFECSTDGTSGAVTSVVSTTSTVADGSTWYFVACRHRNGVQISVSVNAGTPQTAAYTGSIFSGSSVFRVGDLGNTAIWTPGLLPYDGLVDEVSLWSRELSDAEITTLYNSGNGLAYPWSTSRPQVIISDSLRRTHAPSLLDPRRWIIPETLIGITP